MKRGEVYWVDLGPPVGRRPVLVVSRSRAIPVLSRVVVVPIKRTIRSIASEVPLGGEEGLHEESVACCDNVFTIPKDSLGRQPAGELSPGKIVLFDRALRFALEINF